jgi:hypothetical protein
MFKGHAETAAALNTYYLVPTVTIDNLVNIFGWKPDLVKIDVEGAESLVLRGSAQLAKEQQTIFMVEMHSPPELPMIENAGRVLDWCRQHKYKAWYMRDAVHLRLAEQIADRGKCHLLLMSEGKEYPPELAAIKQRDPLPSSEL